MRYLSNPRAFGMPFWLVVCGMILFSHIGAGALAKDKDDDLVDGAICKLTLKSKSSKEDVRHGAIRVYGNKLYQRNGDEEKFTRLVGTKEALGKSKSRLTFTDLSLDRGKFTGVKGKAEIHGDEPGEWSGVFVESDGTHWTVKFTRTQE